MAKAAEAKMTMPRPQFTLKTLLWLMAVVAAFMGGAVWQRHQHASEKRQWEQELRAMQELNQHFWSEIETAKQKEPEPEPEWPALPASQAPRSFLPNK
jgi:hypothetical protein